MTESVDSGNGPPTHDAESRPRRLRAVGLVLLGLAATASGAALALFPRPPFARYAWPLYVASMALFMAACHVLSARSEELPPRRPIRGTVMVFGCLILGVAAIMRLYRLDTLPFGTWRDEANIGAAAEHILTDPTYRPVFVPDNAHPFHLYAIIALYFRFLGVSTYAVRLVAASFGLATVLLAFVLGRALHGDRFGLLLAFFFAVSRWHINFSRFGIPGITDPFFELLSLWLMLHAKRTGRLPDFAWAGLAVGLGLNFYAAFRLFTVVVVVFLVSLVVAWWFTARRQPGSGRSLLLNVTALIVAGLFAVAPLAQFALHHPEAYWGYVRDISIFQKRDEPDLGKALLSNTTKHLLMFNYEGDRNGRHNLPGEPMLDPVTGVLFVLGLGLALGRPRRLPNPLFLAVFIVGLSAGIFSLDFEAPQSNRAIGSMVAALYFAALAAETLWRSLDRAGFGRLARYGIDACIVFGGGAYVTCDNAEAYFVRQATDGAVWRAFNGVETLAAQRMLALGPDKTTIYASVFLANHEVIEFLAPGVDAHAIIPPGGLPIHEPGDKPVAIFVDSENTWIIEEAKHYYPNANYRVDTSPDERPVLYTAIISPEDVRRIQGLTARYWPGETVGGKPRLVREEKTLEAEWPTTAPLPAPFVAEWSGVLYAPEFGDYELLLRSPARASLWLDEDLLLSKSGEGRVTVRLPKGHHALRVRAAGGVGAVRLAWRPPASPRDAPAETVPAWRLYLSPLVSNHGLLGSYFNGPDWRAPPVFTRVDPFLDMYVHIIPLGRPYSVEWAGQIAVPVDGVYAFGLRVHGRAHVLVDDRLVVESSEPTEYVEGKRELGAGPHKIRVRYLDHLGASRIHLYWTPPGAGAPHILPSSALLPYS